MISTRPSAHFVARLRHGEQIVAMVTYKGQVLVATQHRVYRLRGNHLQPILFEAK